MSDHRSTFSQLSAALEALSTANTHWIAAFIMVVGAVVGLTSVDALDTVNTSWTMAGAIVGTGMAVLWRRQGERVAIVAGRASCALVGGLVLPPLATYYFPSMAALNRDPRLLFGSGALAALLSFLLGYAVFSYLDKRQTTIGSAIVRRFTGKPTEPLQK